MRVHIQSNLDVVDLFKGLELLTNAAQVTLENIVVDEFRNEVAIPMRRKFYERKRFLVFGERYQLVSPEWIDSRLTIRNVVDWKMEDRLHLPEIQLLFGVSIKDRKIHLSSAEEQSGVSSFDMTIEVHSYDLELQDE